MTVTDQTSRPGTPAFDGGFLVSSSPATGEEVGRVPVSDADGVRDAVEKARPAAAWWAALGYAGRRTRLLQWRATITQRLDEITDLMHRENGKPTDDAMLELLITVHHIDWAAKKAAKVLGPRRVASGMLASNIAATLEYAPLGVVGVIGPWNYPVFTPMGSIAYALAAGNAVVFKPSEYTPLVGKWLVDTFAEVVPEHPVLTGVYGGGETGAALTSAGVDKIAFTGSTATAKKIMAAAAATLTPVLIECGGKDPLVVDADADLDAAADAAVWGGLSNGGQTCIGTERVYVHEAVYEPFLAKLTKAAESITPGEAVDAHYGPATMPSQLDVIRRHVDDALARGGKAVVGGSESVSGPFVEPVILTDVPEDAAAVQEETFGPTLTVSKVKDMDEAVERANGTPYGLGAAVFSKRRGVELARRIRSGMTSVNSVLSFAGVASLPFGGVGDSGFGRIHGEDGLREFTRPKAIARQRFGLPMAIYSFTRTDKTNALLVRTMKSLYGRRR
ncbi:aldehyde dehydrogenase family protein [Cryptosporangium phraense]|uniref:Aldehyde dehydrogenase n=1 Tax=Cryptosporangium phraense TaxID=2593070 RepID=A0A545AU93_9ACTN|nr:aldehyde dehydrogenase family protein [Cryptosporangium phraense]TQS44165.1 aldehyde dehydrogenase family protein [Cryptosporangium phraense]